MQNRQRLKEIISKFSQGRVLVVGDLILDEYVWGSVSRISPEAPIPVVEVVKQSSLPGGAANVANNIHSLGGIVFLSGVVGQDGNGNLLKEGLLKRGMENKGLVVDRGRPTTMKTRIIAHHQQVVRVDRESKETISDSILKQLLAYCRPLLDDIQTVVIEDYGKGVITAQLMLAIKEMAGSRMLIVDPRVGSFSQYKGTHLLTPNRHEAEVALGKEIRDEGSLREAGKELLHQLSCQAVLITLGEDGMCLFQKEDSMTHIPTIAREVYDVSGAGDTVVATASLALSVGATLKEAAQLSNLAAGIVVGKVGTATLSRSELERILDEMEEKGREGIK
ncbi:D-glycero-beta-D-manno-heptose-7-phosphate kinase [bacterium]|nr:D-glycero-beta-D-manno-heptose-7-phosphate kinase [bacterium]